MLTDPALQRELWVHPGDVVYVIPLQVTDRTFAVLGYVRSPGIYSMPIDAPVTMMEAVAQARGLEDSARAEKTYLLRRTGRGDEVHRVDLLKVAAAQEEDIVLQHGDIVIVSTSWGRRTVDGILRVLGLRSLAPSY